MLKITAIVDVSRIYAATEISLASLRVYCGWVNVQINSLTNGGGDTLRLLDIATAIRNESTSYDAIAMVLLIEINNIMLQAPDGEFIFCQFNLIENPHKPHITITLGFDTC